MLLKFTKRTFLFLATILILSGCEAPPCAYDEEISMHLGFYTFDNNNLVDTLIDSVSFYLLDDEMMLFDEYYGVQGIQKTKLPPSMVNDTTSFVLMFDSIAYDTISLLHTSDLKMESHECGFVLFFNLDSVWSTNNRIDSARIIKDHVDYGDAENVKIYF